MTCRELTEFILAYLENELPAPQRRAFEGHLGECPACVDYLTSYCRTIAVAKRSLMDLESAIASTMPEELIRAIVRCAGAGRP